MIGVLVHGIGSYVYTMSEKFKADSNLTIEVLQRVLQKLEVVRGRLPPRLCLQMDNCVRENKNQYVYGYLSWLVERKIFDQIELSFLPVGHTHEDIDQMFSRIALALRQHGARDINELHKVVQGSFVKDNVRPICETIESVADFHSWLKPYLNEIHNHANREVLHIIFKRSAHGVMLQTKRQAQKDWQVYPTPSCGFHLLKESVPHKITDSNRPPNMKVKQLPKDKLVQMMRGLTTLKMDNRLTQANLDSLMESLKKLNDTNEVPFQWVTNGLFRCETGDISYNDKALEPLLTVQEQAGYDSIAREARSTHGDFDIIRGGEDDEDDHHIGAFQTGEQHQARNSAKGKAKLKKANDEKLKEYQVSYLEKGHWLVIQPENAAKSDKRPFWLAQVAAVERNPNGQSFSDVENPNVVRQTQYGDIEYFWFSPWKKNINKSVLGDAYENLYSKDSLDGGQVSGNSFPWVSPRILFTFTTMEAHIAKDAAASEYGPVREQYKLPHVVKQYLKSNEWKNIPPRTLQDTSFTGEGVVRSKEDKEDDEEEETKEQDLDELEQEEEEEENYSGEDIDKENNDHDEDEDNHDRDRHRGRRNLHDDDRYGLPSESRSADERASSLTTSKFKSKSKSKPSTTRQRPISTVIRNQSPTLATSRRNQLQPSNNHASSSPSSSPYSYSSSSHSNKRKGSYSPATRTRTHKRTKN